MNWDTIKLFLALHRNGSARSVAENHDLSPSTVTRRITDLENNLGVKLFNRLTSGFQLTESGHDLLHIALRMENDAYEIERKLYAKKTVMQGSIRLTIPYHLITTHFMVCIKEFSEIHPKLEIEVIPSWEKFSLDRGEADIAIRIMLKGGKPPQDLIGTKLANIYSGVYASKNYVVEHDLNNPNNANYIGWENEVPFPDWVVNSSFPHLPAKHKLNDPLMQVYAVKAGVGLGMLPCFLCDQDDDLVRVPKDIKWHRFDIWLLSHPDLRDTARFRELRKFIKEYFENTRSTWEGD